MTTKEKVQKIYEHEVDGGHETDMETQLDEIMDVLGCNPDEEEEENDDLDEEETASEE